MRPEIPQLDNPFTNCKIVADNIDVEAYRRQEPGIDRGHPDYVMGRSSLMSFRACPSKWRAGWEPKDTDATDWGTLIDCRVLTPHKFLEQYVVEPETYPATKTSTAVKNGECEVGDPIPWNAAATFCKDWKASHAKGKIPISHGELVESDTAVGILFADERICKLMDNSRKQVMVTGQYVDRETKIAVSVRTLIDLEPSNQSLFANCLADLKTARNAHPRAWARVIDERCYDAQAGMALDLHNAATGEMRTDFLHAIQENTHPWQVARRMLSQEFLNLGRAKVLSALRRYCWCLGNDHWPDWDEESPFSGWGLSEPEAYMISN